MASLFSRFVGQAVAGVVPFDRPPRERARRRVRRRPGHVQLDSVAQVGRLGCPRLDPEAARASPDGGVRQPPLQATDDQRDIKSEQLVRRQAVDARVHASSQEQQR